MLTDSTAVCGPADFSLKDEANRKKLKNFIIEQLYPDDPDGWRAALSVFAVPVWNRFETVWYAPQEIVGFAPKIRRFSEYSTVQQNVFKCRLYEVLQDLSSRAGAFTAVTGEQRLLVSCLSDPYFDPEKDLYVINDRNPVIIRWGVISEGGNPEPLLQKFFSTCGSDNSQEKSAPGDDFSSEGAKFSSSGSESAAPETEPGCTNNGSDSATTETDPWCIYNGSGSTASEADPECTNNGSDSTASEADPGCIYNGSDSTASETEPVGTFNRSVDRNSKPKGKAKVFSSRRPQKEVYYNENITGDAGLQNGLGCIAYTLLIICWITYNNIADKPEDISYKSGIGFLIFVLIFFCSIFNNKRRN